MRRAICGAQVYEAEAEKASSMKMKAIALKEGSPGGLPSSATRCFTSSSGGRS